MNMSLINKGGFYIMAILLGGYYGIFPLLGIKVWVKYKGWIHMDIKQSLFNIIISLLIIYYIKHKEKQP